MMPKDDILKQKIIFLKLKTHNFVTFMFSQ